MSWWVVAATGFAATVVVVVSVSEVVTGRRRVARYATALSTLAHEGGHALVAVVTGGEVHSVHVFDPHSGVTYFNWLPSRFSGILTSAAGYAAPPLLGLGIAVLIEQGKTNVVLILTVACAAALLLLTRDLITLGTVLTVGGIAFVTVCWGTELIQAMVACLEAWLLLLGELSGLLHLVRQRIIGYRTGETVEDDATALADLTFIPGPVWILGWAVLNAWAVLAAVPLLWPG